jgi:hypothetical protein
VCAFAWLLSVIQPGGLWCRPAAILAGVGCCGVGVYDLRQTKRSVLRNYPIIGHIRFMLE